MEYIKIFNCEQVEYIMSFFHEIFWEEPNYDGKDFYDAVKGTSEFPFIEYYLVSNGKDYVGFCGLYANNSNEVWLGWFGIRPQYRRNGYARNMLHMLMERAKGIGYKFIRTYTDKVIDNNAYKLYESEGFIEDSQCGYNFVTMVKCLTGETFIPWKGTPLGFESEPPHHFD